MRAAAEAARLLVNLLLLARNRPGAIVELVLHVPGLGLGPGLGSGSELVLVRSSSWACVCRSERRISSR